MARRKPTVKDPRETPQATVEEPTSAVTAPEVTPPASVSEPTGEKVVQLSPRLTRIDR